jgi:hypothetical protein
LKQILQQVSERTGQDTILSAALINSLPLIVTLLSTIGLVSLVRLFGRATHPGLLRAGETAAVRSSAPIAFSQQTTTTKKERTDNGNYT